MTPAITPPTLVITSTPTPTLVLIGGVETWIETLTITLTPADQEPRCESLHRKN